MGIVKDFESIGAKVRVSPRQPRKWERNDPDVTIDILIEKGQEIFDIRKTEGSGAEITVVDRKPKDRHLLLMVKTEERPGVPTKTKYLCGHDEFHWFVATASPTAADVGRAKESLKPVEVRAVQTQGKKKKRAPKGGVKRQGEWFFIPKKKMKVAHNQILKNEPIQRGRGKPHTVEEVWRTGGRDVYVHVSNPEMPPLSPADYTNRVKKARINPGSYRLGRADAKVFGRGKVTHLDHSTLKLDFWHQILPNTESKFNVSGQLQFID